ncbi:MAG TPA: glycoside hydrolase family 15 protein [Casimicrobiaceae bacterium]|nr:glycoside hydrolase family 15 protein [Casimicrobiaceae bacterium]
MDLQGWPRAENSPAAPGRPGIAPTWTSSAKDLVTTSHGPGRVWVTLGYGILNEVYWPSTGQPQVRDLGFIVAGPKGWFELKRVRRYAIAFPAPCVPLPRIIHDGDGYRLELEVVPDPARDCVMIAFRFTGDAVRLYALLAPHLGGSGEHNSAQAADTLTAWSGSAALCLMSDGGFSRGSAGYVGYSDGWQDFAANGAMSWTYPSAEDGNVALLGELAHPEGVLALGFADTVRGAQTLAASSLHEGFEASRRDFVAAWEAWGRALRIPDAPPAIRAEAYLSAAVLRAHEDRAYPGAIVASLSIPWGNTSNSIAGYHMVWTRDAVEAALGLLAVGQFDDARRALCYLMAIQRADGSWSQNCFPDGRPFWTGIQLDEVAFPVLLAAKLRELRQLDGVEGVPDMVRRAVAYLVASGPVSPQDRWEEVVGISPFTIGVVIAALVGASAFLDDDEAEYVRSLADYWNERIEDWTYIGRGPLAAAFGVDGYYVRIGPSPSRCGLRGRIELPNRLDESVDYGAIVGMDFLYLVRLGLREANDARIRDSLRVCEGLLGVETPSGIAYHRYNEDGYGEHDDGGPYDGTGTGRAWPLLTGERGHYDVLSGEDPLPYLEAMSRMTGPWGMLPEQIWDTAPIAERDLEPGKPTASAMPLVWAHAEFLKLLVARELKRPIELLDDVQKRYDAGTPPSSAWHWRQELPFSVLPRGRDLIVEADAAFVLHLGFDGWLDVRDRESEPLPWGRHGVRLAADELAPRGRIDFTRRFVDPSRWEGADHEVQLGAGAQSGETVEIRVSY